MSASRPLTTYDARTRVSDIFPPGRSEDLPLRRRLDLEQRAGVFVGEEIEQPVGALPHVADTLLEFPEQALAANLLGLLVEHDAFEMAGIGNLAHAHRADQQIVLPRR